MTAAAEGTVEAGQEAGPQRPEARGRTAMAWWLGVALAAVASFVVTTWPLATDPGGLWSLRGDARSAGQAAFTARDGALAGTDQLQNVFIDAAVVANLRALREPYLDEREGTAPPAGEEPLRTTSLNLPWTPVVGLLAPLAGLTAAYNATLLLSTVATALAAFGLLRRHTRWPLLAAAGALAYAASPHRTYQLSVHFNAVMWWAFPLAALAWEVTLERWAAGGRACRRAQRGCPREAAGGRRWGRPAAALAAVVVVVGLSGEYHLALYMAGLVAFLVAWALGAAALARRALPVGPALAATAAVALASGYVLVVFAYAFAGSVGGGNGAWSQVELFGLGSPAAFVAKGFGESGEGMVYLGLPLLALAAVGLAAAVAARDERLPWAVLLAPLALLTLGPAVRLGGWRPYRWAFEQVPLLSLQRVPQRLMVLTALAVVLLAVAGADRLGAALARPGRPARRRLGAALAVLLALVVLADYRIGPNRVEDGLGGNAVVAALRATGDGGGPILGLPVNGPATNWNAPSTYVAALAGRRVLNAYNQTPAPWLNQRLDALEPLEQGGTDSAAMAVLEETGTGQVVVIDEPHVYQPGGAARVAQLLVASGRFRLVAADGPLTLLERAGG
jgi:hypothetical protein